MTWHLLSSYVAKLIAIISVDSQWVHFDAILASSPPSLVDAHLTRNKKLKKKMIVRNCSPQATCNVTDFTQAGTPLWSTRGPANCDRAHQARGVQDFYQEGSLLRRTPGTGLYLSADPLYQFVRSVHSSRGFNVRIKSKLWGVQRLYLNFKHCCEVRFS